jgi:hypothetical protein
MVYCAELCIAVEIQLVVSNWQTGTESRISKNMDRYDCSFKLQFIMLMIG